MANSTAFRFALFFSVAFALLTMALGVGIYWSIHSELRRDLDQRILTERSSLLRQAAGSDLAKAVADRAAHEHGDMRYALLGADGRLIAGQMVAGALVPGWSATLFRKPSGEMDPARALTVPMAGGARLVVAADPEAIEELDAHMVPIFIAAFGVIVAIGAGGAFILGRALRRRLEAVDRTANAIIAGDLSQRVPLSGSGDEFDRLATTLNLMLERIAALLGNLRQVSGDIAHDLRTPLTRLRQKLELGVAGGGDAASLREVMIDAIEHSDDMLALFAAILSISEVEAGGARVRKDRLDLSALVLDLAESYRLSAEDKGQRLSAQVDPGVEVDGNRELLAQLCVNVLDNALHHTPPGTAIAISLTNGEAVELVIEDSGPGIPAEESERVFGRFIRLERSRSTPGHGLGLSLVAAIAKAHGGEVRIEDNRPGVKLMVRLPKAAR
ncbi:MAG: Periplasmic sensor signal transduction histidine kinase [Alphaproteobacteria bacterium]|nr:Periplasmic sensor signal transduction histidine kinase [Alphaproteobacteria bacterium]